MSVNLTFTANGDPSTARDTFHPHDSGVVINGRFSFTSRSAVATGTLSESFSTTTGPQTINAAAPGSLSASIGKDSNGDITVIKK